MNKLKLVQELGAGCFGISGLYEDKKGNKFVIKKQPIPKNMIKNGKIDKKSFFMNEILFEKYLKTLEPSQQKLFMRVIKSWIGTDNNFDFSKLCNTKYFGEKDIEIFNKIRNTNKFYYTMYSFSGNTFKMFVDEIIEEYFHHNGVLPLTTKSIPNVQDWIEVLKNNLLEMNEILLNGGFLYNDLHSSNLCFNGTNFVLIDYGELFKMDFETYNINYYITGGN